jgi:hypothetical protein
MAVTANDKYTDIVNTISSKVSAVASDDYFPIVSTLLEQHTGISITGLFKTNDATSEGVMSYITALRNASSMDPSHGLGFAWRKGDGTTFNVYLVDNNPLTDELFVNNNLLVQSSGDNMFLATAKKEILIDTDYKFRLDISQKYAMDLWIWKSTDSDPDFDDSSTRTIYTGPMDVATSPRSDGTHFGMGVLGTQGYQWWYDDLIISTTVGIHTAVLLRLKADPSLFPDDSIATINVYGYGKDESTYALSAYIKKYVDSTWTWVLSGSNTSTNVSDRNNSLITFNLTLSSVYRDSDNYIDVLLTTPTATNSISSIGLYYAALTNTIASGIHVGGKADIYVNDPTNIVYAERIITNTTGRIWLNSDNGFSLPVHSIVSVSNPDTQEELTENSGWVLVTVDSGNTFSTRESAYITASVDHARIKIGYRYHTYGDAIQTKLDSDEFRYSGADNLVKILPPVLISFETLQYKGGISDTELKEKLKDFINTKTESLSLSDVLNFLYDLDITYINTDTLSVTYRESDYLRVWEDPIELTSTAFELGTLQAFYTDEKAMLGITRL